MSLDDKDRLYYETLHDFRTSENRAFEQRTQLFLAINAILAAAVTYSPQPPRPVMIGLPLLGLAVSLLGLVVGLRISLSLHVIQEKLKEYEEHIWVKEKPPEGGPYTHWDPARKVGVAWWIPCSTRKLVCVWPMVLFLLLWSGLLLWRMGFLN